MLASNGVRRDSASKSSRSSDAPGAPRHRDQVNDRVGRSADRQRGGDGVLERRGREDVARPEVLPHHLDDAAARRRGQPRRGRNRPREWTTRRAASAPAPRRPPPSSTPCPSSCTCRTSVRCRPRSRARRTRRACRRGVSAQYFQTSLPRAEDLAAPVAAQHRAGGDHDRRQVRAGGAHHQRRARSCRSRRAGRRRRPGSRGALPRPPSPAGCDRASCSAS